jgi:hypothetical protein
VKLSDSPASHSRTSIKVGGSSPALEAITTTKCVI